MFPSAEVETPKKEIKNKEIISTDKIFFNLPPHFNPE